MRQFRGAVRVVVAIVIGWDAMGGSPAAASTTSRALVVEETRALNGAACPSTTTCEAVGVVFTAAGEDGVVVPITNGTPGAAQAAFDGAGSTELFGIACPSANTCIAAGGSSAGDGVLVSVANGSPGPVVVVPGTAELLGVACGDASTCMAVGHDLRHQAVVIPIVNGRAMSAEVVSTATGLSGVICPLLNDCVAVGASANQAVVVPITSGTPGAAEPVAGSSLFGLACASPGACVAVGAKDDGTAPRKGLVVPITNGAIGTVQLVPGTVALDGVACPRPTRPWATPVCSRAAASWCPSPTARSPRRSSSRGPTACVAWPAWMLSPAKPWVSMVPRVSRCRSTA